MVLRNSVDSYCGEVKKKLSIVFYIFFYRESLLSLSWAYIDVVNETNVILVIFNFLYYLLRILYIYRVFTISMACRSLSCASPLNGKKDEKRDVGWSITLEN